MGCGDDSDDSSAGTGGGGSGGTGGKAGTGGKSGGGAGKAGSSGGGATPAACTTQTNELLKGQPGALSSECVSCLCTENASAVVACDTDANCWPLISCVGTKCADASDQTACATSMCSSTLGGAPKATPVGNLITGKCDAKCGGGTDAGTADAGN
jgi:hypothetical protein